MIGFEWFIVLGGWHDLVPLFTVDAFDEQGFIRFARLDDKGIPFGLAIGVVGCYKGYNTEKGTEGVGRSAHSAVVVASLVIFILDLVAVQVTEIMGLN